LHHPLRQMQCFIGVVQRDQDAELVAAKSCHHIVGSGCAANPLGDHLEEFVAGIVAEAVVDALEVVDVQKHHGQHALRQLLLHQTLGENLVEAATVDQVGQRVVMRDLLQGHARLVELAEQRVDPSQVAFLGLKFFIGQRGADATGDDQQDDQGDGQAQVQAVVGRRALQLHARRDHQVQRPHAHKVSADDARAED
nr:hypothetical protein [Tanacetum cinerariifolium]